MDERCLPSSPLVGTSFEVVDPPPEIFLLSFQLVDGLLVRIALSKRNERLSTPSRFCAMVMRIS
jgi:hypothetical protein